MENIENLLKKAETDAQASLNSLKEIATRHTENRLLWLLAIDVVEDLAEIQRRISAIHQAVRKEEA